MVAAPLDLDTIASDWQRALDAAGRALHSGRVLSAADLAIRQRGLDEERHEVAGLLADLAHDTGRHAAPWLSPVPVTATMLGLPAGTSACLFDLDDVLTDSGVLHASAWAVVFDDLLMRLAEQTGRHFIPFDPNADYRTYIDGRPRLEGIHTFLQSRGIRLPEGRPDDAADAETAYGLARHKSEALSLDLSRQGVTSRAGARRYLEAAGHAGLGRAVVSASASTLPMLELAGLATLVEERIDAEVILEEGLRSRPAPDVVLTACRRLGVRPDQVVVVTHNPAGVAAGLAAGAAVVGIGSEAHCDLLRGFGAERAETSLSALLDRRLVAL